MSEETLNSNITVDLHPVAGLVNRYDIKRTALYDRIKKLGIVTIKSGNRSYINGNDLDGLDQNPRFMINKMDMGWELVSGEQPPNKAN